MNETPQAAGFGARIQTLTGVIISISGLLAALAGLNTNVRGLVDAIADLPDYAFWLAPLVLLAVGVALIVQSRKKRSKLLKWKALRLSRDDPRHLIGREDDIDQLLNECLAHRLVFLDGDSGVGKSALVRAGLLPKLNPRSVGAASWSAADRPLFPIYLDNFGEDWELGPRKALAIKLASVLGHGETGSSGQMEAQTATEPPVSSGEGSSSGVKDGPGNVFQVLVDFHSRSMIPLIIFDQFDDYQIEHRDRFLPNRRRTWLPTERLIGDNEFWREVDRLLQADAIHCLFVTKNENATGLHSSVRFLTPSCFTLDRLELPFVAPLLDLLTKAGADGDLIIRHPEHGWERLRDRLVHDLNRGQSVLPQQLKMALEGLAHLDYLTVADYDRKGGLPGLEAEHVKWSIESVARRTGMRQPNRPDIPNLSTFEVQKILVSLIDEKTQTTVAHTVDDITKELASGDPRAMRALAGPVQKALELLAQLDLVRTRVDPHTRRKVWLLDHDYLCRSVLAACTNKWRAMLEGGNRAFVDAGVNWLRKWRALLGIWSQLLLLWARLSGKFRYGEFQRYASLSALKFVPYGIAMLAAFGLWSEFDASSRATLLWQDLRFAEDELTPDERAALWQIARSRDRVHEYFLNQLFTSRALAQRFILHPAAITRAAVGLNKSRRDSAMADYVESNLPIKNSLELSLAAVHLAILLDGSPSLYPAIATMVSSHWNNDDVQALHRRWLDRLAGTATPEQAASAWERVPAMMAETRHPDALRALVEDLQALASKLKPQQAASASDRVLALMAETRDPRALGALAACMQPLALKPEQVKAAGERLLAVMAEVRDRDALPLLVQGLEALSPKLKPQQAASAWERVLALMAETRDPVARWALADGLQTLAGKPEQAASASERVLAVMAATSDPNLLQVLVQSLEALAPNLESEQAASASDRVLAVMAETRDPDAVRVLAEVLQELAPKLKPQQAASASERVLAVMTDTSPDNSRGAGGR
jgi:hypothetical protein